MGGFQNQRSLISELRNPNWGTAPAIINVREGSTPKRKQPEQPPSEDGLLAALDELSRQLLAVDQELFQESIPLDRRIRESLAAKKKARQMEGRAEYDKLTAEGRQKLAELEGLQAELSQLQDDRNRAIGKRNGTSGRVQTTKRAQPSERNFPTVEEVTAWKEKLTAAKQALSAADAEADGLRDMVRRKTVEVNLVKNELTEIRAKRETARTKAGLPQGHAAEPDVTEEFLSATT